MATKSALKTVYIKDPASARKLINALENAEGKKSIDAALKRPVSTASREEIKKIFANNDRI